MSGWVDASERLPEDEHDTLIVALKSKVPNPSSGDIVVDTDSFYTSEGHFRFWSSSTEYDVTHWMPLPEPPEETK